ncbi:MAG: SHOCT domain-containing protein [Azoarcus sp.]|nr:SHOCT domain-containing protein [Azoarcus sp.]
MGYLIVTIPLIWVAVEIVYRLKKKGNPYGVYIAAIWLTLFPIRGVETAVKYIIESNGINHTGMDFMPYALWSLGFCIILSFALYKRKKEKNRRFLIPVGMNIAAILCFLFIDHFNIMVYHGDWFERGMPGPFEPSRAKIDDGVPTEIHTQATRDINALGRGEITREEYHRRGAERTILMNEFKANKRALQAGEITQEEYNRVKKRKIILFQEAREDMKALDKGKITQEEYERRKVQRGILMDEFEAKFQAKKRQQREQKQREQSEPH